MTNRTLLIGCTLAAALGLGGCQADGDSTGGNQDVALDQAGQDGVADTQDGTPDVGPTPLDSQEADSAEPTDEGAATDPGLLADVDDVEAAPLTTCVAVSECATIACADGQPGCAATCLGQATEDAMVRATPLWACYDQMCLSDFCLNVDVDSCLDPCLHDLCGGHLLICVALDTHGQDGCIDTVECIEEGCDLGEPGGFLCAQACYANADAEAKDKLLAAYQCFQENGGTSEAFGPCEEEAQACLTDIPGGQGAGKGSCLDVTNCLGEQCMDSPDAGPVCLGECLLLGTEAAQDQAMAVYGCFGSEPDLLACIDLMLVCAEPGGEGGCEVVSACLDTCSDEVFCPVACMHEASKEGAMEWAAAMGCMPQCEEDCAASPDPQACMESCFYGICTPLIEACFGP